MYFLISFAGIVEKGKDDLQTEADRSAQRCIIASLSRQYPNLTIIGEEGSLSTDFEVPSDWIVAECDESILSLSCPTEYNEVKESDIVVWVDPLDGTSEYAQGLLEHVTVLIGVAVNGKAIGGVINQPYYNFKLNGDNLGRTLWGVIGLGTNGIELQKPPADKFVVTTTRSHSNELVQRTLDALNPDDILRVGGAGHKVINLV